MKEHERAVKDSMMSFYCIAVSIVIAKMYCKHQRKLKQIKDISVWFLLAAVSPASFLLNLPVRETENSLDTVL